MKIRVLIADDDPVQMLTLETLARAAGAEADGASNAPDALTMIAATRYDAVAVDYVFGAASGLSVARAACESGIARVVLMSAVPPSELAEATRLLALEGHAVAFVQKPFDANDLLAAMGVVTAEKG